MMSTGSNSTTLLKDVFAYVDVWSSNKTENYSKPFIQQLQEMGATVSKTFNKQVTHVVFKNGHQATWNKAKKTGVKLVSVLWVARCKDDGEHVDEELCPALNDEVFPALKKRTHRCMQPRDTPERTPENDRRMRKKLDQMMKDLPPKLPFVTDVSPYIINEEHGIVYSPSMKRSDSMAQRLKEMREKRENLSPTASQMVESSGSCGLKPSPGVTPSTSVFKLLDYETEDGSNTSVAAQHCHSSNKEDEENQYNSDHCESSPPHKKDSQKPWLSPCRDGPRQRSGIHVKFPDLDYEQNKMSRKSSLKKDLKKKNISLDSLESPCQEDRPQESKSWQSQLKPDISAVGNSVNSRSEFKKGKHKNRTVQSTTNIKTYANPEVFKFPSFSSSPTIFGNANMTQEPAKEFAAPSPKVDPHKTIRTRPSFSGLAQSPTVSNESLTVVSSPVDEDDGVFVECASPANFRQRKQTTLLHSPPSETKSHSEQGSSTRKRKQGHSETNGPESARAKKTKREDRQSVTNPSNESVSRNSVLSQQKHPHQGIRKSPSSVDSHNIDEIPMTTRSRRCTLPALRTGELAAEPVKQRASSIPIEPSKQSIRVVGVVLEQQENSDGDVLPNAMESRGTEHVAAGLTDTTSEGKENKQANLVVQKMDKYRKTMRTLVMTSMPTDKQNTVTQVVKTLGGFSIVDRVCESTTHVVSGCPRRTLNILLGIARGCWILSFEWILWCLEQRQWIPEEPYELSDHFPAAPICRLQQHLSAGEHQQDLFEGQPVMFVSLHSEPATQSLVELIQLCGGTVCKTVRQAGICIGTYNGKRAEGSRILSEQWVLDCITHLKQLSYDNYDLE